MAQVEIAYRIAIRIPIVDALTPQRYAAAQAEARAIGWEAGQLALCHASAGHCAAAMDIEWSSDELIPLEAVEALKETLYRVEGRLRGRPEVVTVGDGKRVEVEQNPRGVSLFVQGGVAGQGSIILTHEQARQIGALLAATDAP